MDKLTVTQEDRETAAQVYGRFGDTHNASIVKAGERDDDWLVQAFARYRIDAALTPGETK